MRYFEIVNAKLRAAFYERLLRYKALIRVCRDPREAIAVVRADFPDAWSQPSRWYYDHLLMEKRVVALAWMHGRPAPVSNTFVDQLLSWSNPNKEFR